MSATKFNVTVTVKNADKLEEIKRRAQDLTVVLENIVDQWARGNVDKFALGTGRELSGVNVDPTVYWEPLTPGYYKSKHRAGMTRVTKTMKAGTAPARFGGTFPDWLMVRTGSLRDALTNPQGFFRRVEAASAVFGSPSDPEDEIKARGNQARRPTIFIGEIDMNMIRQQLQAYFEFGPGYQQMLFAKGVQNVRSQSAAMDLEWGQKIAAEG